MHHSRIGHVSDFATEFDSDIAAVNDISKYFSYISLLIFSAMLVSCSQGFQPISGVGEQVSSASSQFGSVQISAPAAGDEINLGVGNNLDLSVTVTTANSVQAATWQRFDTTTGAYVTLSGTTTRFDVSSGQTIDELSLTNAQVSNSGTYRASVVVQSLDLKTTQTFYSTVVQVQVGTPTTSASGTMIPPAVQIIDAQAQVWTVSSGTVLMNGSAAGYSANVTLLMSYNGTIYQQNSSGDWWSWTNKTWTVVASDPRSGTVIPTPTPPAQSTAKQIFNFSSFGSAASALSLAGRAIIDGNSLDLLDPTIVHETGGAWYKTPLNIQSFTTDFTFQQKMSPGAVTGMFFVMQNSNSTSNPPSQYGAYNGLNAVGDANGLGFGDYPLPPENQQAALGYSVGLKFDLTYFVGYSGDSSIPPSSTTGIYADGGPANGTFGPTNDLAAFGIDLLSNHVMSAHVVYDGKVLSLVLTDTVTQAQARLSWPINIPAAVGGNTAYVGFVSGGVYQSAQNSVLSWNYSSGIAKLPAPTFSVAPGSYSSSQNVALVTSAGAKIYYTTNGKTPSTSSNVYSGPITVSSNEIIQAIAVQSGYSDSDVAYGSYQINAPVINFANNMANAANFMGLTGKALISGSSLSLSGTDRASGAWFLAPVNVQNFTTTFTAQFSNFISGTDDGLTFTIQNPYDVTSKDVNSSRPYYAYRGADTGGPYTLGRPANSYGYFGTNTSGFVDGIMNSAAVVIDSVSGTVGFYTNGQNSSGSQMATGLNFLKGDPMTVTISYNGSTLALAITDAVSKQSFNHSWAGVNIPGQVAGSTAYVGFTSGTGAGLTQLITNWQYSN